MPGTFLVDPQTFTGAISMGAIPREVFGQPGVQEKTRDGVPKWTVGVAVSYAPDAYGMTSPSEVLNITVVSDQDPGVSCPAGTAVTFDQLRAGASAPEQKQRADGSTRVAGGRLYWSARAVLPAAASYRSKSSDAA